MKDSEGPRPCDLQGLLLVEGLVSLQAPGQNHLRSLLWSKFEGHGCLGIVAWVQPVLVNLRSIRVHEALEALDFDGLVVCFHEELGVRCRPFRVWWQGEATSVEDLGEGQ